jgi:hypothetical protein
VGTVQKQSVVSGSGCDEDSDLCNGTVGRLWELYRNNLLSVVQAVMKIVICVTVLLAGCGNCTETVCCQWFRL